MNLYKEKYLVLVNIMSSVPRLLKKSIKRLEQRKKSTKKKWAARDEAVDKQKVSWE